MNDEERIKLISFGMELQKNYQEIHDKKWNNMKKLLEAKKLVEEGVNLKLIKDEDGNIDYEELYNPEFIEEVLKNKESDPSERIDISTKEKQREFLGLTDGEYKLKEGERIRTGFKLHKSKSMRYNGFGNEKGTPLKELSKEELIEFAEKLYSIIDDIDTAGDIAKDSDKIFRGLVDEAIDKREKFMTCDCYDILVK